MSERYDAVVIGSGTNGLTAAVTLARAGRSVLVAEAAPAVGGATATEELTLPGFHHDVFSAVHPAAAASPVFDELPLERHGLRWIHPEVAMAHVLSDGRAAVLDRDLGRTVASLDGLAAGDGQRWRAFVEPYVRHYDAVRRTMLSGFPPIGGPARLAAALKLTGSLEFVRILLQSAEALTGELFEGDGAAWFFGAALHGDAPLEAGGSAIAGLYLNVLGHVVGWPSPEGGAGRIAAALAGHLIELGGETRVRARAERLHVHDGSVRAVTLADGSTIETRTVVATTTPHGLLRLAGDALGDSYSRRMARFRYGAQTVKVDWALDAPIPWRNADARRAGTVHVGGGADDVRGALRDVAAGRLPDRPFMLSGQQSLADPSRAPAGKHTAWAYTHVPAGVDWDAERDRFADVIERHVEHYASGFRETVLARHVMAPGDLERRDENLVGGDVGAGSYALDQLVFRPLPSLNPYATPIRGLFIGSASAFPGGAVHGVCGHAAARAALREARLARVPRLPRGRRGG